MAKNEGQAQPLDVSEFLKTVEQFPAVYDAKNFCNRPFTLDSVEWKVFEATAENGYRTNEKVIMHCTERSTGKQVVLESTQKGIVTPIAALEANGLFPCNLMLIQEGKFCSVVSR